ncbi:hypothetical protein Dvina_34420 [Dactylosporangium vinaceum]|uniref:Uncharacterized protein n=1 Tax=Dactylosporangium vinaceum TaxID=53362 RepID=A0ABV5MM48_9ACTN|nr:hypothetical protein [Dactylosporangium vinaceum]UAB93337.1 hypothetical protein Dvina_34420 [Dactylosporangium vinaceum]
MTQAWAAAHIVVVEPAMLDRTEAPAVAELAAVTRASGAGIRAAYRDYGR